VTRWRWNATRALAILRHTGGRRVPAPLIRMRSDDLLAAVFPAQAACQDNAMSGDIEVPDHPLVFETMRDCLTEAMDVEGCKELLGGISDGSIEIFGRDTVQPSAFSHQILNAMPYAFLDDAPLEERRSRAVSLRRALPDDSRDLSALDPAAIQRESANAWPRMRDADELHDALLVLGVLRESTALTMPVEAPTAEADVADDGSAAIQKWFETLVAADRVYRMESGGDYYWVAAERVSLLRPIYPEANFNPALPAHLLEVDGSQGDNFSDNLTEDSSREDNIYSVLRGWVECSGPLAAGELVLSLGIPQDDIDYALGRLENEGVVLRSNFRADVAEEEFCDRHILARIHRATIDTLRREVEPVPPAAFMRFLLRWQHVDPTDRLQGEGGLLAAIEQLQGFESASGAIEDEVLLSRVSDYSPVMLDQLCLGGEVVWGRVSLQKNAQQSGAPQSPGRPSFSRATPITMVLRDSLDWVLGPTERDAAGLTGAAKEVVEVLSRRGASFLSDIVSATNRLPSDVDEALWTLAASGRVTVDGVEALRQRLGGAVRRPQRRGRNARLKRDGQQRRRSYSRWSLLESFDPVDDRSEPIARQLLDRYGILFPELLARDALTYRWRDLVRVLRRLEARGEIRGGRFVSGFVGEQFALPEAIESLRKSKNSEPNGRFIALSACDPLNLAGIISPGPRVAALVRNRLVVRDGLPIALMENGSLVGLANVSPEIMEQARVVLSVPIAQSAYQMDQPDLVTV